MVFPAAAAPSREILSVGRLTAGIKTLLNGTFPSVWVRGEVSNFKAYPSGHHYFTLKDESAQLPAVMFKGHNRLLKFKVENGMSVVAHGRVDVYEARGAYQLIVDHAEPDGAGALQVAFEQLKKKLAAEGLFEASRKRALPFLPRTVGIVTSPAGAAVHDMVSVLTRRFPPIRIKIYPVKVQGEGAAAELAVALDYFSRELAADVVIVGRGGGSLEDLWAFNEEEVARAVARCRVPVVSAVGHETDFTICDFVADLRAPTPSAAAELCVPDRAALRASVAGLKNRILAAERRLLLAARRRVSELKRLLPRPDALWDRWRLRLGDLEDKLFQNARLALRRRRLDLAGLRQRLVTPAAALKVAREKLSLSRRDLERAFTALLAEWRRELENTALKLELLSPRNVLKRGYVLARRPDGSLAASRSDAVVGEDLLLTFHDGEALVGVKR